MWWRGRERGGGESSSAAKSLAPLAAAAGAVREVFSLEALTVLHQVTHGNPRRINRLCDLALLIGFAEEQAVIGPSQIEAVAHELVTVAPE